MQFELKFVSSTSGQCELEAVGNQFFWLMVSDFTVGNLTEVAWPAFKVPLFGVHPLLFPTWC